MTFTQGDSVILNLTAAYDNGTTLDITGVSAIETHFPGINGSADVVVTQFTALSLAGGNYSVTIDKTVTPTIRSGEDQTFFSKITLSSGTFYVWFDGQLDVRAVPVLSTQ